MSRSQLLVFSDKVRFRATGADEETALAMLLHADAKARAVRYIAVGADAFKSENDTSEFWEEVLRDRHHRVPRGYDLESQPLRLVNPLRDDPWGHLSCAFLTHTTASKLSWRRVLFPGRLEVRAAPGVPAQVVATAAVAANTVWPGGVSCVVGPHRRSIPLRSAALLEALVPAALIGLVGVAGLTLPKDGLVIWLAFAACGALIVFWIRVLPALRVLLHVRRQAQLAVWFEQHGCPGGRASSGRR